MWTKEKVILDQIDEDVVFVELTNRDRLEAIVVAKSGLVALIDLVSGKRLDVGNLTFKAPQLNLQLHSYRNYVSITQVHGTFGTVLDLDDSKFSKSLERDDYCASASIFCIGFFSVDDEVCLIHGTEWNRLDITSLKTNKLLTDRIVDCDTDINCFDYFHSCISMSPNSKAFISNGWQWHPYGFITYYSIDRFLKEFEMSHVDLKLTDVSDAEDAVFNLGWDRPVCWLDATTLGIAYNRGAGYYGKNHFSSEILVYDLMNNAIHKRIEFNGFHVDSDGEVSGRLFFDSERQQFIGLNKTTGLLVSDSEGRIVEQSPELKGWNYDTTRSLFYMVDQERKQIELIRQEEN